jgi:hypothetical protein
MIVSAGNYIRPYYPGTRIHHYPAQAGQVFVPGAILVKVTATNEVMEGGADASPIVGIAAEAAQVTLSGNKGAVWMADEENEFVAHVQDGATPLDQNIGLDYGIVKDATNNIWRVDLSDTTNVLAHITQVLNPGEINGRVVFKVLNADRKILAS